MSDPKTSLNNQALPRVVPFQDRLYVAGNASFLCFVVAVLWSALFLTKPSFSTETLIVLASPLVATGATVLVAGMSHHLVPKPSLSSPLQFSIPVIWCLICYLAITLMSTQEMEAQRVPEQLLPALVWSRPSNLLPVCLIQIVTLWLCIFIDKRRSRV